MSAAHRNTIFVEDAAVIQNLRFPEDQFILRLNAPDCAARARAGMFAHIRCDDDIPMRRPLSIMRVNADEGWVEFLYKIVGQGLRALSKAQAGDRLNLLAPIGNGFQPSAEKPLKIMIGGGVGIPPMVFLAEEFGESSQANCRPVVFMGSEVPFPFDLQRSALDVPGLPESASAAISLLEDMAIPSRLASLEDYDGCYRGFVTELAREYIAGLKSEDRKRAEVFACGPEAMLEAAARLARDSGIPCQLCLEEFMACAVGGCAGCSVQVHSAQGAAMKRVCVDGPVFAAESIYPN